MALYLQLLSYIKTGSFEKGGMEGLMRTAIWNHLIDKERLFSMKYPFFQALLCHRPPPCPALAQRLLRTCCAKNVF